MQRLPGFIRTAGLTVIVLGIALVATLAPIPPKEKMVSQFSGRHRQRIQFVTSSGTSLASFFADLAPNPKRLEVFTWHSKSRRERSCDHADSLTNIFTRVVHAQGCSESGCNDCPGSAVDEIGCTECGADGYGTQWYQDILSESGWQQTGDVNCSYCCYLQECVCP